MVASFKLLQGRWDARQDSPSVYRIFEKCIDDPGSGNEKGFARVESHARTHERMTRRPLRRWKDTQLVIKQSTINPKDRPATIIECASVLKFFQLRWLMLGKLTVKRTAQHLLPNSRDGRSRWRSRLHQFLMTWTGILTYQSQALTKFQEGYCKTRLMHSPGLAVARVLFSLCQQPIVGNPKALDGLRLRSKAKHFFY